jgi:4-amino-4-deoxy-L-arabinose transferase-like glycosyltransferase
VAGRPRPGALGWLAGSLAPLVALLVLGFLASYRLDRYPDLWYDEGVNLQAARNLVMTGRYGLVYDDRLQLFDPQLTTGPTVIGPVAAAFALFGVGLTQARAVIALYTLLAGAGLCWVGSQVAGRAAGALAVLALAAVGDYVGVAETRSVVGEVPALAYLLLGTGLLASGLGARRAGSGRTPGMGSRWRLAAAGGVIGLAVLTKAQLAMVIPGLLLALWRVGRRQPRGLAWDGAVLVLALAAPMLCWQLLQLVVLGPRGYLDNLAAIQAVARVSSETPPLRKAGAGLADVAAAPSAWLGLLALAYLWLRVWRADPRLARPAALVLPVFATLSWAWFVCFSMGWSRLAVPAIMAGCLCVGLLLRDGLGRAWRLGLPVAARSALVLGLLSPLGLGLARNGLTLGRADGGAAFDLAALVNQRVEPGATIETNEWELDLLVQRPAHHPPVAVKVDAVAAVELDQPASLAGGYEAAPNATYLIDGRFSKLDRIYSHELGLGRFTRIASLGDYDLYQRI